MGAENRSAVWHALNFPGLLVWLFLQLLSEPALEIWLALPLESCSGDPETSTESLPTITSQLLDLEQVGLAFLSLIFSYLACPQIYAMLYLSCLSEWPRFLLGCSNCKPRSHLQFLSPSYLLCPNHRQVQLQNIAMKHFSIFTATPYANHCVSQHLPSGLCFQPWNPPIRAWPSGPSDEEQQNP